ncbi:TPA: hypothetical protein NJ520_004362 [Vibrio parahaemolyticus]|nr:hypothetical protein [Vibrio parahaemolyticus]
MKSSTKAKALIFLSMSLISINAFSNDKVEGKDKIEITSIPKIIPGNKVNIEPKVQLTVPLNKGSNIKIDTNIGNGDIDFIYKTDF